MNPTSPVSNRDLQTQIVSIAERIVTLCKDVADIKEIIHSLDARIRDLEKSDSGMHPVMNSRIDSVEKRIDKLEQNMEAINKTMTNMSALIEKMWQPIKAMLWVATIIGGAILLWLVNQWLTP